MGPGRKQAQYLYTAKARCAITTALHVLHSGHLLKRWFYFLQGDVTEAALFNRRGGLPQTGLQQLIKQDGCVTCLVGVHLLAVLKSFFFLLKPLSACHTVQGVSVAGAFQPPAARL